MYLINKIGTPYKDFGHCACLFGRCLKRHYLITDYIDGRRYYARFCNEYLKLKHHEYYHRNRYWGNTSELLMNEIGIPKGYALHYRPNERRVHFVVCDRPFCIISMSLQDSLTYFSENLNREMEQPILSFISPIADQKSQYKKYQSLLPTTETFLRKMRNTYDRAERIVLSNEFALFLLQSKLNLK